MEIANLFKGLGVNYILIAMAAIHTLVGSYQIKKGTMIKIKHYIRFVLLAILGVIAVVATVKGIVFTEYIQQLKS